MLRAAIVGIGLSALCLAQNKPGFDVASIRPSEIRRDSVETGPDSLTIRGMRLVRTIAWAYSITDYQVSGPQWLNETQFDIMAKAPGPATEAELRTMLQGLLSDRFKLATHREKREIPALIMTVAKGGHKLKPVEQEGSPSFQTGKLNLTGKGATLKQLTDFLSRETRIPIIDQTGLSGRFDYFLDINAFVTDEMMRNNSGGGPPVEAGGIITRAVQEQLGLHLESKKAPVEMLVVDKIEKTPTEN